MAQFIELDLDQGADFTVDLDLIKDVVVTCLM